MKDGEDMTRGRRLMGEEYEEEEGEEEDRDGDGMGGLEAVDRGVWEFPRRRSRQPNGECASLSGRSRDAVESLAWGANGRHSAWASCSIAVLKASQASKARRWSHCGLSITARVPGLMGCCENLQLLLTLLMLLMRLLTPGLLMTATVATLLQAARMERLHVASASSTHSNPLHPHAMDRSPTP